MDNQAIIAASTLEFLNDLKANNSREWFVDNKKCYETAKKNNIEVARQLAAGIHDFDKTISVNSDPKDFTYRIYRDIRFSYDKTPYKTNMGAFFVPGGKKSGLAGYYLHIEPSASFVSGGIYMAEPKIMKAIRNAISDQAEEFLEIVNNTTFKKTFSIWSEESLKRVPTGFDAQSPVAEYLKMKHISPLHSMSNKELTDKNTLKKILECFFILSPLIKFLNKAIQEDI